MDCRAFNAIEDELLDGSVEPATEHEARAHLDACARCRGEFEEARAAILALRGQAELEAPQGMWESFRRYAARRDEEEALGFLERIQHAWRKRVSAVCLGMILFITVVSANATRRLQTYVVPAG